MNDNLLVSLSKYHPREGHTPLENFITESFAWILRNNDEFTLSFFRDLLKIGGITDIKKIETQVSLSGTYPDMVITTNSKVFIFEHKTFTPLPENQIGKYRQLGEEYYGKTHLVLITSSKSQHDQDPDTALTWLDVHNFINQKINSLKIQKFLKEFADLLKEHGLGPQPALTYESIISYLPAKDFRKSLSDILWKVFEKTSESPWIHKLYKSDKLNSNENIKWNGDIAKFWGRVGTEFLKQWRPGIFIGCIVENKDHGCNYSNHAKGIDYSLIISFDQESFQDANMKCYGLIDYQNDDLYKDLVSELRGTTQKLEGYEFYEHLTEQNPNLWHPLYIRKPLAEILRGCETQEDQVSKLLIESEKLIELITNTVNFNRLREKYRVTI